MSKHKMSAVILIALTVMAWASMVSAAYGDWPNVELYIRRRGAHGTSGIWPEWHVGLSCWTQTLYCRVLNYGVEEDCDVVVYFWVYMPESGLRRFWSERVYLAAAPEKGVPSEVTVSISWHPEIVGKYYVYGILYYGVPGGTTMAKYQYHVDIGFRKGEGVSRDINVGFKVQEHL